MITLWFQFTSLPYEMQNQNVCKIINKSFYLVDSLKNNRVIVMIKSNGPGGWSKSRKRYQPYTLQIHEMSLSDSLYHHTN